MDGEPTRSSMEAVQDAAKAVADGAVETAQLAASAVNQFSDGVTAFRSVIRKQPLTLAFMMLAMGYLIGAHLTQPPRPTKR